MTARLISALAAVVLALGAAPAPPSPAAQTEALVREAILGWCMKVIGAKPLLPLTMDGESADWLPVKVGETTNDLKLFNPKAHARLPVILDVAPENVSCFVQGAELDSEALATRLRAELSGPNKASLLEDTHEAGAHMTLHGLVSPDSDQVPMVMIVDYGSTAPGVVTAVVRMGAKGQPPQ